MFICQREGKVMLPHSRDKVDAAVTVSEAEIVAAMRLIFERMKVWALTDASSDTCRWWTDTCATAQLAKPAFEHTAQHPVPMRQCRDLCLHGHHH